MANGGAAAKTARGVPDTVVMSGGAPMSPLMAGFLCALWEEKKTFRNFHTSGAGALMALLFLAPKGTDPGTALTNWAHNGVADEIYKNFPVNFKLFHKPGPFSPVFQHLAQRFKIPVDGMPQSAGAQDPVKELLADWLATLAHDQPGRLDILRRRYDPVERIRASLRTLWLNAPSPQELKALGELPDPIKRFREKWLTSVLTTPEQRRLYNDLVDLVFSAPTPSTLTRKSEGLAAPLPFLEDLVDFKDLDDNLRAIGKKGKKSKNDKKNKNDNRVEGHLCVNAYNITKDVIERPGLAKRMMLTSTGPQLREDRRKEQVDYLKNVMDLFESPKGNKAKFRITPEGIRAAFSMPFIYPPARVGDDYYSEGADHQPINFHSLGVQPYRPVVLLDVLADLE